MIWLPCDRLFCWWSLNFVIQTLLLLLIMCSVFLIIKLLSLSFIAAYIVYCVDNGWCHVVPLVARPWSTPLSNIHLFYTIVVPLALSFGVWYNAIHLRNWITRWVNIHMFYTLVVIAALSKYWVKVYMVHNYIHTSIGSKYTHSLILLLWLQLHIILIAKPNKKL